MSMPVITGSVEIWPSYRRTKGIQEFQFEQGHSPMSESVPSWSLLGSHFCNWCSRLGMIPGIDLVVSFCRPADLPDLGRGDLGGKRQEKESDRT